jgi:hypothetical protein
MKKKICTYFLLLVLTIQILPIQQMGSLLFSNQFTEEIPHSLDIEKDGIKKADLKSDFLFTPSFSLGSMLTDHSFQHLYFVDDIPQNHTGDIHVPPPNC